MKEKALYPEYFDKFKCIGSECKNTCCGGWDIYLDKQTLKKYKNSNNSLFKGKHKELFDIKNNRNRLILNENQMCPFLDEDKLCLIHNNLGPNFLCDTCRVFPRTIQKVDDTLEVGLTTACEEAAKLILSNEDGIYFISHEYENHNSYIRSNITNTGSAIQKFFWTIRVFIIELLQYRELSIEERLTVVGLFINKLNDSIKEHELEDLISYYTQQVNSGSFSNMFDSLDNKEHLISIQADILNSIQKLIITKEKHNPFAASINSNLISNNYNIELYIKTHQNEYNEFISDKLYIIENYLVNTFYISPAPFADMECLKDVYIKLIIRAGLLKNIITNSLISEENLTEQDIYYLISILSRIIDHNRGVNKGIAHVLKKNNFSDISHLLTLIV